MSRRDFEDEADDDEDAFDDEPWDAADDDDADGDTLPCPYCGAAIYDDAVRCPKCGEYLSREERPSPSQPKWVVITVLILLIAVAMAYLR